MRQVLPDDLRGKSVLDLGCNCGFFCFEAAKRGASRVVGIDVDPDSIRKARLLADCLGHEVVFEERDIERTPIDEPFDYVLCFNLLHHLKNPIGALDRLIAVTRERLILEVATLGTHDRRKLGLSHLRRWLVAKLPIIYVGRSRTLHTPSVQKFYITPAALENLLIWQRGMFASLDLHSSEHKGRFLAVAHKRRIDHLLVLAGPTASGKRTVAAKLLADELPEVTARLGASDMRSWGEPVASNWLTQPGPARRERMILRYDTMRSLAGSTHVHARDETLDILETAERATFLTIWAPPDRLEWQLRASEEGSRKVSRRHRRIMDLYRDPARVLQHYKAWFAHAARYSLDHLVISFDDDQGYRIVDEPTWRHMITSTGQATA